MTEWLGDWDWAHRAAFVCTGLGIVLTLGVFFVARRMTAVPPPRPSAPPPAPNELIHDPFVHGSASEKRNAWRRKGSPVEVMISDAEGKAPPRLATVTDRSVGGIRLLLDDDLPVGTFVSLRPSRSNEDVPWIRVEVRNSQKTSAGWELGCQFVRTPASSILWQLG
jgi:hypothetical protein